MRIYIVRHGATETLEKRINQKDNEPLNENGVKQAKELGKRFLKVKLDLVVSSPLDRAVQTAEYISPKIEKSIIFSEIKRPSELIGLSKEDERVMSVKKKIGEMYVIDPKWHYADEENYEDLYKRGMAALEFLKSKNLENILVVTHANFIALMIGLMLFDKDFTVDFSLRIKRFLQFDSTGVTICSYVEGKWKLECLNDTSHRLE